ncbi:MAG: DUF488 family protein, N3 subclade [Pseudobdellovibrionaceae bacterium]
MIKRASVSEIKDKKITKAMGYLVVTMRMYPRFLQKSLIDDYCQSLSPQADLFARYREFKKETGDQNKSFELAHYQEEFALTETGMHDLEKLVEISKKQNVYMICQCDRHERCHVDLMLLIAQKKFGAKIGNLPFDYDRFISRI